MKLEHRGHIVYIDEDQADWFDWEAIDVDKKGYLSWNTKECWHYPVHQMIIGKAPKGFVIDHINRNKLDNRRQNLRFVTPSENTLNSDRIDELRAIRLNKEIEASVDKIIAILDRPSTGLPKGRFERV